MADVRPFRGVMFNPAVAGDLGSNICPPYDVISPRLQSQLYSRSAYNVVRLEDGALTPDDTPNYNRYTRAAETLSGWIKEHALIRDETPAYYLIQQTFEFQGESRELLGLIAAVRLEDYEEGVIKPHEFTQSEPKKDRLALMEACKTNISHIMLLYRDSDRQITNLFNHVMKLSPSLRFSDPDGNSYSLWRIATNKDIAFINHVLAPKPLYIADGHHRYETALAYKRNLEAGEPNRDAASNFVMSYLVELTDPGLLLLPYHRLVRGLDSATLLGLSQRIDQFFSSVALDIQEPLPEEIWRRLEAGNTDTQTIALVQHPNTGSKLLTFRAETVPDKEDGVSSLGASLLEEKVLKPALGGSVDHHVTWVHDAKDAVERVMSQDCQMAFLLKPLTMDLFESIVSQGGRLPRKSTFFYPKLPTGLAINSLKGDI